MRPKQWVAASNPDPCSINNCQARGFIVLGNMDSAAMRAIRQGDPDRVNYDTLYPVARGVRDYL